MKYRWKQLFLTLFVLFAFCFQSSAPAQEEVLKREEAEDYYSRWLNEDVAYIISEEERAVFESLTIPEEKELFIEQFWFRRDPDPRTSGNEFKEEHYRRIAYANDRFASGIEGWRTDRGRIYIIHGEPAEIESHPSGGRYDRPINEGGGTTATFPFEIWRYRHIEGIGNDVVIEFVDPSFSGEYRLALYPEEKDALLYVPGAGMTLAEQMGMASRADRPWFSPGKRGSYPMMPQTAKDSPFARYETYSMIQRPLAIKYNDLKELVKVNVDYAVLPVTVRGDYFRLNDDQILVPITLQVQNKDLTFNFENDIHVARLAVYGMITSIANRVVQEFEDDLIISYKPEALQAGLRKVSIYQKVVPLDRKMRYKLDLILKDLKSEHIGVTRQAIIPPNFQSEKIMASSLILASQLQVLESIPSDERFVLGDVKLYPNVTNRFTTDMALGVYLQVYNVALDQSSLSPSLRVTYRLLKGGQAVREAVDENNESTQFFSTQRVVLTKQLDLGGLDPGKYGVQVEVRDKLTDQSVTVGEEFSLATRNRASVSH
jgi:GWxTD domain-containing protein